VRTVGAYFDGCIDDLSEQQLLDYFTDRLDAPFALRDYKT